MQPVIHVMTSKFRPPRVRSSWVYRTRLIKRLNAASTKVILVISPSGFGKTSLLSSWVDDMTEPAAWLSVGTDSNALQQFLRHLITVLAPICEDLPESVDAAERGRGQLNPDALARIVLTSIERCTTPWTLILDDYYILDQPDVHAFVSTLIDTMPDDCKLVISTRSEPPLPIARLRVSEDLTLLKSEDMGVTVAEAHALLAILEVEANDQQVRAIVERTAGWIVAIHLIGLAARTRSLENVLRSLQTLDGELDLLGDYLMEEVLGQESEELHEFLVKISVFDRFTLDACVAVTGNPASAQLLEQVRRGGLFLIDLDDARQWFRFHDLFREFLRRALILVGDPDLVPSLHAAASAWFRAHNMPDEALEHAVRANDWAAAAHIICAIAIDLFLKHRLAELLALIERFPIEVVLVDPDLSSIAAYAYVRQGRLNESTPYLEAAERGYQLVENNFGLAVTSFVRGSTAHFRDDGAALIEHAKKGLTLVLGADAVPDDLMELEVIPELLRYSGTWIESLPHAIPYIQMALGLLQQGRVPAGERIAEQIVEAFTIKGYRSSLTSALSVLAKARVDSSRLVEAEAIARPIAVFDLSDLPVDRAVAAVALAKVLYAWDRLDECEEILNGALDMLKHAHARSQDSPIHLLLARIRWARGDYDGARQALELASSAAADLRNLDRMREIDAFHARLALAEGDLEQARRWSISRALTLDLVGDATRVGDCLVQARMLIATGEGEKAVEWLERMRRSAEEDQRRNDLIHILAVLSIAYLDVFELDHAVDVLRDALAVGEPGGYLRVFLDESLPMLRLLRIAHRRGVYVSYIEKLQERSGETPSKVVRLTHADLLEPITAREIEVLKLVALGLTNKEISDELYLAVATVKRHITNLNGKLGVSSRTEAVQKARSLGFLTGEHSSSIGSLPTSMVTDLEKGA